MDSFELNKIAGAVLGSLLFLMVIGEVANLLVHPHAPEESVLDIEVPEEGAAGAAAEAEAPAVPFATLLANASVKAGERQSRKCMSCHNFEEGAGAKIGPDLWGVVGRDKASVEGFSYSEALTGLEGAWTFDDLSAFIEDPRGYAPGTKMSFAGLRDAEDRADLLVWLRTRHPEPLPPLPEPPAAAPAEGGEGAAPAQEATPTAPATGEPQTPGAATPQPQQ